MNSSTFKYLISAAVSVALLAAVWLATRPKPVPPPGNGNGSLPTANAPTGIPNFDKLTAPIYDLHKQHKWSTAKDEWEKLHNHKELSGSQQLEVEKNYELAVDMATEPQSTGPITWVRSDGDKKGTPDKPLTEAEIIAKYPVGRTIRNVAAFDIQGMGTNKQWFLKSKGHFAFRITNQARTKVTENTGNKVVLRVKFEEATQLLAVSEIDEVKLEWPKGRLAKLSIEVADGLLMDVPFYSRVRWGIDTINQLDPDLKGTLTYFAKQLKANGVDLAAGPNGAELITQVEQLSGKEFEITYIRVLGVTEIRCLNGAIVPQETLANLAHNSSLLIDAYLAKVLELKEGESLPLRGEEVAGLIGGGYRAAASGNLELQRAARQGADDSVQLELRGEAPVNLTFAERNGPVSVKLTPNEASELTYSKKDGLVTSALIDWKIDLETIPDSLLLRGTTSIQATCKSHYEAKDETPSSSSLSNPAGAQP